MLGNELWVLGVGIIACWVEARRVDKAFSNKDGNDTGRVASYVVVSCLFSLYGNNALALIPLSGKEDAIRSLFWKSSLVI